MQYYSGPVLFPFGWGLSYTTFSVVGHGAASASVMTVSAMAAPVTVRVNVTNTGSVSGDDVIMAIVKPSAASVGANFPGANDTLAKQILADFTRVSLDPGQVSAAARAAGAAPSTLLFHPTGRVSCAYAPLPRRRRR